MGAKKKPQPASRAERQTLLHARYGLFRTLVRSATVAFVVWMGFMSIREIAGKDTSFKAVVNAVIELSADRWVFLLLSGVSSFGWYRERRLRQKTIAEQAGHIGELERKVDPKRLSSGLGPTGAPRKEDLDAP